MTGDTVVPLNWLLGVGGMCLGAFVYWLRTEFSRNWEEHKTMTNSASKAHKEIDQRIDRHHAKIDAHIEKVHRRIDWMIKYSGPHVPPYPEEEDSF